jgi:hypothetical protein
MLHNKTELFSRNTGFSREILKKNLVLFPSGNFAGRAGPHWKLRRARRASAPGRTGIFQVPLLHTWSEGHGSFKTNELTPSTAMPRDRRIAQPFIQIQAGSDYFNMICVSQIIFICFVDLRIVEHGRHAVRVIDNAPGTHPSRITNFNVDTRMLKVMIHGVRRYYILVFQVGCRFQFWPV